MALQTDYLIVGGGAMGLAFADVLVAETDARAVIVDRHDAPGGHWNDAYDFVRLHQPSTYYGVASLPLGGSIDHRATGAEVRAYFAQAMERLLATGRVRYFPSSDWLGGARFVELGSGDEHVVAARRAVVDATYTQTDVPSTRPPPFPVAPGVRCVPVNALASLEPRPAAGWVILGGGKTAMDACLWLLRNGVAPRAIRWVRPRDAWMLDRAHMHTDEKLPASIEGLAVQLEAAASAQTIRELFQRLGEARQLLRLDDGVVPTMYRCAILSQDELGQLKTIEQVVRLGHVQRIEADRIVLDRGAVPTGAGWLHVDCTARGLKKLPSIPVFGAGTITLQPVSTCQPTFSAALIARIEATVDDAALKNALAVPVPYPEKDVDWMRMMLATTANRHAWSKVDSLRDWVESSRLNAFRGLRDAVQTNPAMQQPYERLRATMKPALENLQHLLAQGST
jgi:hypothetical protein